MGAGTRASSLRASSRKWVGSRPTRAGRRNPATRRDTGALRSHNPSTPSIRGNQCQVSCPGTAPALTHETRCARREIQTEDHHFSQQKHVRAAPRTPGDQRARPLGRRRRTHGERIARDVVVARTRHQRHRFRQTQGVGASAVTHRTGRNTSRTPMRAPTRPDLAYSPPPPKRRHCRRNAHLIFCPTAS